jgi:hypothetical protein
MSIEARVLKSGKTVYDVRLRDPHGRLYKRTVPNETGGGALPGDRAD